MKHKTKSIISLFMALCLMLSLGVGALADLNVVDPTPENIPGVTFGDPNTLTNTDPSTDPGADDKEKNEPSTDPEGPFNFQSEGKSGSDSTGGNAGSGEPGNGNPGSGDSDPAADATITIGVEPAGSGTVTVEGKQLVDNKTTAMEDEEIIFIVEPDPGYTVDTWSQKGNGSTVAPVPGEPGKYSFIMGNTDVEITFYFKVDDTKYDINIENITNGTVETYPAVSTAGGTPVKVTAVPEDGYELGSISVTETDGTPVTVNGDQFIMPNSAVNVTATFTEKQPQTHHVYVDAPHADFYSAGGSDYAKGAVVSFTVTPHRGYRVTGVWAGAAKLDPNSDGSYSFSMPGADITVKVECERVWWPGYDHWHSIDASYDGDYGYVTVDSWAYVGGTVYFTVHPYYDSWYYYDYSVGVYTDGGVKLDVGHYAGDTWYFTMPNDDVTVYAWFDWYHGDYSVSKSVEGDGSIYVRSWADHGDKVWIDAVPQSGASLTSLNVYYNGGSWWYESLHGYYGRWYEVDVHYDSARGEYYFYMPAHDVVVEAVFTTVGESITVVKPDNGSLKLSTLRAEKGDLVYITVDPDKGYELSELEVLSSLGKNVEVTELSENYYVFRMPGLNVKVKAEFRLSAYTPFADVSPNAWYFEAVSFVYDKGLMEGTSNYAFSPDADLSRGMLAAILYRMAGSPEVSGYSTFGDVPTTAYYARAIAWAQDHGIVTGVSAESYKPDSPVTREQLVAILSRYAQYKGYETSVSYDYLSTYGDASSASAYAREALNWAVARGVIDGQSGGVLAPTATASRAEVAQVLMNYLAVYA